MKHLASHLILPDGGLAVEGLVVVETHLLQHNGGQQAVAGGAPVGQTCHGGVQVVALLFGPVVGVDDQLWDNSIRFSFWTS